MTFGEANLRGVVHILNADPASYRAFGPYWWGVKSMLRHAYPPGTFYFLGTADEPRTTARLMLGVQNDVAEFFAAALHHFETKVRWGERYQGHSTMPDTDETYELEDPDMGPANSIGA